MGIKLSDLLADDDVSPPSFVADAKRLEALEESVLETPITLTEERDSVKAGQGFCLHCSRVEWLGYMPGAQRYIKDNPGYHLSTSDLDKAAWAADRDAAARMCESYNMAVGDTCPMAIPWPMPLP